MSGLLSRTPSNQFCPSLSHPRCYQKSSALPLCLVLITVIHFLLGAPKIWYVNFKKFKIRLTALVVLSGLTTYYLRSFVLYTGFLSNPAFSTIFFLLVLTFKSLNNQTPSCLSDLIQLYVPSRQLRSSADTRLLRLPSTHLKSSGRRVFFYQAPLLCTSVPFLFDILLP